MTQYNENFQFEKAKQIYFFLKAVPHLELTDKSKINLAKRFDISKEHFVALVACECKSRKGEVSI